MNNIAVNEQTNNNGIMMEADGLLRIFAVTILLCALTRQGNYHFSVEPLKAPPKTNRKECAGKPETSPHKLLVFT